jgi:single-strand DNA-binding protein
MSKGTINKVILIGRIGKDPEMRYAATGTAIASFPLATNHGQKNDDGSWEDITEWHNIKAFGKTAEFAGEYVKKGSLIFLEGRLQTNNWEDQQGQKHYRTEIITSTLQLLGPKSENQTNSKETVAEKQETVAQKKNEDDDDLPF